MSHKRLPRTVIQGEAVAGTDPNQRSEGVRRMKHLTSRRSKTAGAWELSSPKTLMVP